MADFGYDVSDYRDVDPIFGDLADLKALIAEAHERGMKVILDYVPNHTSDQHPWFQESRSSRDDPKRDWYIWRDPAPDGGPPNNWRPVSAARPGPATPRPASTITTPSCPSSRTSTGAIRTCGAMLDVMRFWLDRGVDGFRVDALSALHEDEGLRDNPPNPDWTPAMPDSKRHLPIQRPTCRMCTRRWPKCGRPSTPIRTAC